MTFWPAVVIGLIQGVTEFFPILSLGDNVLLPSWFGGTLALLVRQESMSNSPYLAFIVGLHLATAIVLLGFYAKEWIRRIGGFLRSCYRRKIETDSERLAWLIVVATIPVGLLGLIFEHLFRTLFCQADGSSDFLTINGSILGLGEFYRRRSQRGTVLKGVTSSDAQNSLALRDFEMNLSYRWMTPLSMHSPRLECWAVSLSAPFRR
ncbi:MAG: undecaprenyl-diphosphate phosphatase [Actinomycetota bacterium]|nr:undecaprenyl-diphosphate phosphatase [Actinomycetota bacterium]